MPTRPQSEFTLDPIIHSAKAAERLDRKLAPQRYWVKRNGQIVRDQLLPPMECYIIVTGEVDDPVRMSFETTIPINGLAWDAPIVGQVTLSCPQTEVHRLISRWKQVKSPDAPGAAFADMLIEELRQAAYNISESELLNASGAAGGGTLGAKLRPRMLKLWGLSVDLWFTLDGERRIVRRDVEVKTRARLLDFEDEVPVVAVVELLPSPQGRLRALATIDAEEDLRAALAEELRAFYSERVGIDALLDVRQRETWKPDLAVRLGRRTQAFGWMARLVHLDETPPAMPGELEEVVKVTLENVILPDGDQTDITVTATLRLSKRSMLLRAMAPRPKVRFGVEFQQIARGVILERLAEWTTADLQIGERKLRETELSEDLDERAVQYGYVMVRCMVATARDAAGSETTLSLTCRNGFATQLTDVVVEIAADVNLTFKLGVRGQTPGGEMKQRVTNTLVAEIAEFVRHWSPSAIYRAWAAPLGDQLPLHDQLQARLVSALKFYAEDPSVTATLINHAEFVGIYERVLRTPVEAKAIRLTPDNVPGEVMIDLHARVNQIQERAWSEMATRHAMVQAWDPIGAVTADIPRMMQTAFAAVLGESRRSQISKRQIVESLRQRICQTVLDQFSIGIVPEIRFYAAPEVVDFYARQARERQRSVMHYFELRDEVADAIFAKRQERIRLIKDGYGGHPELVEVDDALKRLQAEEQNCGVQTESLQREFADATNFVNLLSAPVDPDTSQDQDQGTVVDAMVVSPPSDDAPPEDASSSNGASASNGASLADDDLTAGVVPEHEERW